VNIHPSGGAGFFNQPKEDQMDQSQLMKLAIAGGIVFAAYKWGNSMVKGAALAVGAVAVAKHVPYVKDVL
jgi:hypothetical protein